VQQPVRRENRAGPDGHQAEEVEGVAHPTVGTADGKGSGGHRLLVAEDSHGRFDAQRIEIPQGSGTPPGADAGLFAAGGYRYEKAKLDEEDVEADIEFSGLFLEAGVSF